jgi:hypothetical protein
MSLSYGSAKLNGFLWKDYSCLQKLDLSDNQSDLMNSTLLATISDKNSNEYDIQREKDFLEKSYAF